MVRSTRSNAVNIKLDPGSFWYRESCKYFSLPAMVRKTDLKDKIVIDYGCGSGILGVAALLLGAKKSMPQTSIRKLY
jgi:ribosomal protein L11 methyltransferase